MQINCAIIDDEPLACELLRSYIQQIAFLNLRGIYHTTSQAIKNLTEQPVELVFLDINMPDVSGIELKRMMPTQTLVVFTTAYKEYAIEGYRVGAIDYLMKPINFNEFLQAANKVLAHLEMKKAHTAIMKEEHSSALPQIQNRPHFVFIKTDHKTIRIELDRIAYVEGQKDYARFHVAGSEENSIIYDTLMSMKNIVQRLPQPDFMRIHRSYIINVNHIQAIDRGEVIVNNDRLPISEGYKPDLMQYIKGHSI